MSAKRAEIVDIEDVAWRLQVWNELSEIKQEMRGLRADLRFYFTQSLKRTERTERMVNYGPRIEAAIHAVEKQFGVPRAALFRKNPRHEHFAWIRHLLTLLLHEQGLTPICIAEIVHRSRSNIGDAVARARARINRSTIRRREYEAVCKVLGEGNIPPAEPVGQRKEEPTEKHNTTDKVTDGAASADNCAFDGGRAFEQTVRRGDAETRRT